MKWGRERGSPVGGEKWGPGVWQAHGRNAARTLITEAVVLYKMSRAGGSEMFAPTIAPTPTPHPLHTQATAAPATTHLHIGHLLRRLPHLLPQRARRAAQHAAHRLAHHTPHQAVTKERILCGKGPSGHSHARGERRVWAWEAQQVSAFYACKHVQVRRDSGSLAGWPAGWLTGCACMY